MRKISVSDNTIKFSDERTGERLSFRLKIEIARILDRMGVSVIELNPVRDRNTDYLLVKSLASAVKSASICVAVDTDDPESPSLAWDALKDAARPRLQVPVPVSTVQMEYFCHRKPAGILEMISDRVAACTALCHDVEFVACDFTRSEPGFLRSAVQAAVDAGATLVTVSDAAGDMLPDEFRHAVSEVREMLPEGVRLGVKCSNELHLANACAVAAVRSGADEIKATVFGRQSVSLERFPAILAAKSELCGAESDIVMTGLHHSCDRIRKMCEAYRSKSPASTAMDSQVPGEQLSLANGEDMESVLKAVRKLGYELSDEDGEKVYEAFVKLSSANGTIAARELDAIVASVAFQVPPTYRLESYVTNSGNVIAATCHIRLRRGSELLESACIGDGPIDAAFMAIDKVIGRHYELDDFQIKSVTEGRQAMGDAVVRLRHCGKVYSGRGVSTDIIGSSIMAYLNAVNKIAYEEAQS